MKKIVILAVAVAFMAGCGGRNSNKNNSAETNTVTITETKTETVVADNHNAKNSLDYAGTYKGTLPCADCEGIETTLDLDRDGTYKLKTKYLTNRGGDDIKTEYESEGVYVWNEDGNSITLKGVEGHDTHYLVQENQLVTLDQNGKRITGDHADLYILRK